MKRYSTIVVLIFLVSAFFVGRYVESLRNEDIITKRFGDEKFKTISETLFSEGRYFYSLSKASGFGGPVTVLLKADSLINEVVVADHSETSSYFNKLVVSKYLEKFIGKSIIETSPLSDMDNVSGATLSSVAIKNAIKMSANQINSETGKGSQFSTVEEGDLSFLHIYVILSIFLFGIIQLIKIRKIRSVLRWSMMLSSIIILGFWYNRQLSVVHISSLVSGYMFSFRYLFEIILLIGIMFFVFISGKNPYCRYFCPFGAVQECLGQSINKELNVNKKLNRYIVISRDIMVLILILISIVLRDSSLLSYEVFGSVFSLTGNTFLYSLLVLTLVFSVFIKRPWCRYLCPVSSVIGFLFQLRKFAIRS